MKQHLSMSDVARLLKVKPYQLGFTVPLKVDLGTGHTWAGCKKQD